MGSMKENWREDANCKSHGWSLFFGSEDESPKERILREATAKTICNSCSVVDECLEDAQADDCYGIWGGLTMVERKRRKMQLEHEAYMRRRFGEWPKKIVEKVTNKDSWQELESRLGWRGEIVTIAARDANHSPSGMEYSVTENEKLSYVCEDESDAWLYFASLTIT